MDQDIHELLHAAPVPSTDGREGSSSDFENALRPLHFQDFAGQSQVVQNLKVFVEAARYRGEPLDHTLLHGPPGLGKTTLSNIIANELGVGFKITSGPVLDKPGDLAGILTSLEPQDVLFIDEIHRLSPVVEEYLYSAMEDYRIDIMIDRGPSARSIQIDLNPFTLVGATTRSGLLTAPLRARFGINLHLEYYDATTLKGIVLRSASILGQPIDEAAAAEIAGRSRGTPRIANALLRRVRDFAQVKGNGRIDLEIAKYALEALNIDRHGLDLIDRKILLAIIDKFKGGPVGITTIATAIGEDPGTVEEVYEPFLIKEGFIKRTPRGREVTDLAYEHLNLTRTIYGKPLVYLDNGATTQKPQCVIDAITEEYLNVNANVHRGVHYLSQEATRLYEEARETVRAFINAHSTAEIVFTRGTTEGINLVAATFGQACMQPGDEVIVTEMEHHSNIVPWQLLQMRKDIKIKVCPITDDGRLDLDVLPTLFSPKTKLLACTHVSNVLGTVNPVKDIIAMAHARGVPVLIDAAQSVPHMAVDVQDLDCDFLAFSGHKVYGPTGIGVLYGKEEWLEKLPPYMGGGEMIGKVSFEHTTFNVLPYKFEAGTPDYVAARGLAVALDFVRGIGMDKIAEYEHELTQYALTRLREIPGMTIYGHPLYSPLPNRGEGGASVISFNVATPPLTGRSGGVFIHHLDLGTLLDRLGIAVRTGHHCAEPLMHRLGIEGTVRASFALYNTKEEVDALVQGIDRVRQMF